jgi:hypothetical protein
MAKLAVGLIEELDARFFEQTILDATGIVYAQYWLQAYAYMTFPQHLEVLKDFYGSERTYGIQTNGKYASMVCVVLSGWDLNAQQGLFKLTMKSNASQEMVEVVALAVDKVNPQIVNPFTCLWEMSNVFHLLSDTFLEYLKFAEIAMMHVLGYEQCFSSISFLKSKLRNHLNPHLQLVVAMYAQ